MTMTATARSFAGALRHEVEINGRHRISTSVPRLARSTPPVPSIRELIPATIAWYVTTAIGVHARARGWRLDDVRVDVSYDPDSIPSYADVVIELPGELAPDQLDCLRRAVASCPVEPALVTSFTIDQHRSAQHHVRRGIKPPAE